MTKTIIGLQCRYCDKMVADWLDSVIGFSLDEIALQQFECPACGEIINGRCRIARVVLRDDAEAGT